MTDAMNDNVSKSNSRIFDLAYCLYGNGNPDIRAM